MLLDSDPRPVWIQAWGGANTIAQAFYRIKTSHAASLPKAIAKARIYSISDQDFGTSSLPWISNNFKGLQILKNMSEFLFIAYPHSKQRVTPSDLAGWLSPTWMRDNIRNNHGSLCSAYPRPNAWVVNIFPALKPVGGDAFISEGDSLSYFHTMNTGLRSHEHPSYGGWGNRFGLSSGSTWVDVKDGGIKQKSGYRFLAALQSDWAARADWCVKSTYATANHHPKPVVQGGVDRSAIAGSTLTLSAIGTTDPDGNTLSYKWWQYQEADSATAAVPIANATTPTCFFTIPNEKGRSVHVILEVTDNGKPALTRYQRVIVTVGGSSAPRAIAMISPVDQIMASFSTLIVP